MHCDPTASHYLKLLLDILFGSSNFRNEIVWSYGLGGSSKRLYSKKHDTIFFYTRSSKYVFNKPTAPATSQRLKGKMKGAPDVWDIPALNNMAKERIGYPMQKPLALLERIIRASSERDNMVLDPFCGCATTCIAAERLDRQWIGIDVSKKAFDLVNMRLKKEIPDDLASRGRPIMRKYVPTRTDLPRKKKPTQQDKIYLYGIQRGNCKGCNDHFKIQNMTFDHITPQNHGGSHEIDNLQLLCGNCNSLKGDRPMEYLQARRKQLYGSQYV